MRVLIGFDGSEAAGVALDDLRIAGLPEDVDAVVLTVSEVRQHPPNTDDAQRIVMDAAAKIRSSFPDWRVLAKTAVGSPAREILAEAERVKPDLIVIGQRSQPVSELNVFLGHTSQTLLTSAECSVRVSRRNNNGPSDTARLLIGFDGSGGSTLAVDDVASRPWPPGSEVRLVLVVDSSALSSIGRFAPQMVDASVEAKIVRQWGETLSAASVAKLTDAGLKASTIVNQGQPKDAIVEYAKSWNADAIFVGSHCSDKIIEHYLLGSVATAVAAQASCSVEVVRNRDHR